MRAALYARFSSELQDARSITDQVSLARRYAETRGLNVVAVHEDAGISGEDDRDSAIAKLDGRIGEGWGGLGANGIVKLRFDAREQSDGSTRVAAYGEALLLDPAPGARAESAR